MRKNKTLRLKYRLEPIGEKSLEFEIYEMDEIFRCPSYTEGCQFPKQNMISTKNALVTSFQYPFIFIGGFNGLSIGLRGNVRYNDHKIISVNFNSEKERNRNIKQIHSALKEWSINWFKTNKNK